MSIARYIPMPAETPPSKPTQQKSPVTSTDTIYSPPSSSSCGCFSFFKRAVSKNKPLDADDTFLINPLSPPLRPK